MQEKLKIEIISTKEIITSNSVENNRFTKKQIIVIYLHIHPYRIFFEYIIEKMKIRFLLALDHRVFKKIWVIFHPNGPPTHLASKVEKNCDDPHRDTSLAGGINFPCHGGWTREFGSFHFRERYTEPVPYLDLCFEPLNFKTIRGIIADLMACLSVADVVLVDWTNVEDSFVQREREKEGIWS